MSVLLAILAFFVILAFFFFLGCPFELIKCYITRDDEDKNEDNFRDHNENGLKVNDEENIMPFQHLDVLERPLSCKDYLICFLIGIIGLFLQPFYLGFYLLYAIMQCYRRMPCFMYYSSF